MFVRINEAYASLRRRLGAHENDDRPRYVRKAKVTGRRIYARPAGHRADSTRPSYSHPATRARRAVRSLLTVPRVRRALRTALPTIPARTRRPKGVRRESTPARSTRAVGRAVVLYVPRTVNASVRAWLADARHACRSHRHPSAGHRRDHVYLPNIGWCWDTDEFPRVTA